MPFLSRIRTKHRPPSKRQGRIARLDYRENYWDGTQWCNWLDLPNEGLPFASGASATSCPDDTWTKQQIVDWLRSEGGVTTPDSQLMNHTKAELLDLADNGVLDGSSGN